MGFLKWVGFTLGRFLVAVGEAVAGTIARLGWATLDRFGTRRQVRAYSDKRLMEMLIDLRAVEAELDSHKPKSPAGGVQTPSGPVDVN